MFEAVIVDLIHGSACSECLEKVLTGMLALNGTCQDHQNPPSVFLMCGSGQRLPQNTSTTLLNNVEVCVLDGGSISECLYSFKQTLDRLNLTSVAVLTSGLGERTLAWYQEQLFTAVYSFQYVVRWSEEKGEDRPACGSCRSAGSEDVLHRSVQDVRQEVSSFLQSLPAADGGQVTVLKSSLIPECFGHGFSTRTGGVSYLPGMSSLNVFCSPRRRDPRAVVAENTRRLALQAGFYPAPLQMVKVNHGSDVWVLGKAEPDSYDAIVTDRAGVVIAAPGADCMPILFCDAVAKVIGAAHAGWKGTLMGAPMATVDAMVREFGCQVGDIVVAVGPSVGGCCFTLDRQRAMEFHNIHPDCVADPQSPRPHVNIRLATRILLQRGGVLPEHIHDDLTAARPRVTPCTSCHPEASFFSHERDGANFGTQVGFLWIPETTEEAAEDRGDSVDRMRTVV